MQKMIKVVLASCLVLVAALAQAGWDPNAEKEAREAIGRRE